MAAEPKARLAASEGWERLTTHPPLEGRVDFFLTVVRGLAADGGKPEGFGSGPVERPPGMMSGLHDTHCFQMAATNWCAAP
eukprot:3957230-Pyramimonas_sp.AAC.2